MDQGTVESGLSEFLVLQQAQISVSEACHKEKSPVPERSHVLNFCYRSESCGELLQISVQLNDNLQGWDSGNRIFKNSPSDSKGQPRLKTTGLNKYLVLSIQ